MEQQDALLTVKVGNKSKTLLFRMRYSFAREQYYVPRAEFEAVAKELGVKEGEQFFIEPASN